MKLRNEIAELRSKSKIYAATAHNLQACRTYKSVWLEYASSPLAQKDTFYKQNGAALQTYYRAASQLDKMGISLGTEPEKVRQLVTVASIKVLFRGIKASIHTRFALSHAHDLGILHYREHYPT